jgi:hypothetical protein
MAVAADEEGYTLTCPAVTYGIAAAGTVVLGIRAALGKTRSR